MADPVPNVNAEFNDKAFRNRGRMILQFKNDGMNLDYYDYSISKDFLSYEFCSKGPNGKIKKAIRFKLMVVPGHIYFNLGFGDLQEDGTINDIVTSNNQDTEKYWQLLPMQL